MTTEAERREESVSVAERMRAMSPDELGGETLPIGERWIIAQQIESLRIDFREANRLTNDRIGRMETRLSEMIGENANGIAANRAAIAALSEVVKGNQIAIAANANAIESLSNKLMEVRIGIKGDVIAAYKEECARSDTRKGWLMTLLAAIIGSGITVSLTVLAARLGLMSF